MFLYNSLVPELLLYVALMYDCSSMSWCISCSNQCEMTAFEFLFFLSLIIFTTFWDEYNMVSRHLGMVTVSTRETGIYVNISTYYCYHL